MSAEPKVEVIGRLQKAIEARDMPTVLSFFDPSIEYHYHVGTRPLKGIDWVEKFSPNTGPTTRPGPGSSSTGPSVTAGF